MPEMSENDSTAVANKSIIINCSQSFYFNEAIGRCSPVCGEYKEFPHNIVVTFDVITALLYIFHLIGTGIALAFSCYNRNTM